MSVFLLLYPPCSLHPAHHSYYIKIVELQSSQEVGEWAWSILKFPDDATIELFLIYQR